MKGRSLALIHLYREIHLTFSVIPFWPGQSPSRKFLADCSKDSNLVDDMQQSDSYWIWYNSEAVHWNTAKTYVIFISIDNTKTSLVYLDTLLLNSVEDCLIKGSMKFWRFCSFTFYGWDRMTEFCQCHVNMHSHC